MDSLSMFSESGIYINIKNTVTAPKKKEIHFNPGKIVNRSLALYALGAYIETGWCINKTLRCLDALGATGIAGLSWAKNYPQAVITINDPLDVACNSIKENGKLNNLEVEVIEKDVNVLLHQRSFDFVFLDSCGSSVHYMDALFRNAPKNSLLVITSTDDSALYGKVPEVTLRNYGSYIAKTFYSKELASRLIIATAVRAAAKYHKGIEVMSSIAVKSHITLILKVTKGPAAATQCVNQIRKLLHCCICEDRAFFPQSIFPVEHPYSLLSCDCRQKNTGQVAVELGPVWSGPIFDPDFCLLMLKQTSALMPAQKIQSLLSTVVCESLGGHFDPKVDLDNFMNERSRSSNCQRGGGGGPNKGSSCKKMKIDTCPPFYYNLQRHSPKGYDLGKLKNIVKFIQESNYQASRTHFDPEAIRTTAPLKEFNKLLTAFAKKLPPR